MKLLKNQSGFTLIEMVLVIIVLGILAAVAMVQFGSITTDAKNASLDGATGPYSAQLALAVNTLKGMPTLTGDDGAETACDAPTPTSTAYEDCVYYDVLLTGSGAYRSAYSTANDNFALCTGATCTISVAANLAANGDVFTGTVTCDGTGRFQVMDFQSTGAIFVSAKGDC